MKLIIDIPDKVIAHIRSNYGHGVKCLYDEDKDIIIDAIYENRTLQAELEEIKAEIQSERNNHQEVGKYTYTAGLKVAMDLIDNHIKE